MRNVLVTLLGCAALVGCTGQQVKAVSGKIAGAVLKETVYHAIGANDRHEDACRDSGGNRNPTCERRKKQSFLGNTPEQERFNAAAARAESRERAQRFEEGWSTVRGTPNCIDNGVGCADDSLEELEEVSVIKRTKRVVSPDNDDFTTELEPLFAQ